MGGAVEVGSAPGDGTRVGLTLPLPVAPAAAVTPQGRLEDLTSVRVLTADDNAADRMVLTRLLGRLGASVVVTGSGPKLSGRRAGPASIC